MRNFGVVQEVGIKDYVFGQGKLGADPDIMPDGDWLKVDTVEDAEMQFNRKFDSWSCTNFGEIKAVVAYMKEAHGVEEDYSERWLSIMSNTQPNVGNSVRAGLEAIRKYGLVTEADFPSITEEMTEEEYFDKNSITPELLKKGQEWLKKWDFSWEMVPTEISYFKSALKKSPLLLTGYAWNKGEDGLYRDYGMAPNHCFVGVKVVNNCVIANDTYPADFQYDTDSKKPEFIKKLAPNFHFGSAHRICVRKKAYNFSIKDMIKNIWVWFETVGSPKGLRAYYCPTNKDGSIKGRQAIDFENPKEALKILFSALNEAGMFKKTSWPEVKPLDDKKFI